MFKTTEDFGQYLQNLIDRHREDLSILLQKHGYGNIEPTPALLVLLFDRYGSEFVEELASIKNFEGDDDLLHAEGANVVGKLTGIFTKGAEIVGKVQTVAGKIAGKESSSSSKKPPVDPPKENKTKKIVITGVVVLVVLTVIFIIVKNRKK